ncbi:MAG: hypothetical protein AAF211_12185, partial [Myxococcota bacterium]
MASDWRSNTGGVNFRRSQTDLPLYADSDDDIPTAVDVPGGRPIVPQAEAPRRYGSVLAPTRRSLPPVGSMLSPSEAALTEPPGPPVHGYDADEVGPTVVAKREMLDLEELDLIDEISEEIPLQGSLVEDAYAPIPAPRPHAPPPPPAPAPRPRPATLAPPTAYAPPPSYAQ